MQLSERREQVLIEYVWPRIGLGREAALLLGGSLFIALCAQLRLALPFSPVPITGQTLAVLMLGALYGSTRGASATLLYLGMGALGLPVFAGGGFGFARLAGPTGGYLAGFVAAAFVVGLLSERGWDRRPVTVALSMLIGNAIIYLAGLAWLSRFVAGQALLTAGLLPFLAGDALKLALAMLLLPAGWNLVGRQGRN